MPSTRHGFAPFGRAWFQDGEPRCRCGYVLQSRQRHRARERPFSPTDDGRSTAGGSHIVYGSSRSKLEGILQLVHGGTAAQDRTGVGVARTSSHTKLRTCVLRRTCRGTEVARGEGSAGSRFQVFLESNRVSFGRKLNRYDERPRAVVSGVAARPVVVPLQPRVHVVCDSDVVPQWIGNAAKDVNEALLDSMHGVV